MALRVGVSSGIYYAARDKELSNAIRKLGYTLTRGVATMEISGDVAHEVPFTHGIEIRHMAKKQGVTLTFHGDLAVPICIPERGEWRDAHDKMKKSIRSAVFIGAKYVDFHSCLNTWLELITYAGRKLTMSFCDSEGNFISGILKRCEKTRKWFIKEKGDLYFSDIFDRDERTKVRSRISVIEDKWHRTETDKRIRAALEPFRGKLSGILEGTRFSVDAFIDRVVESSLVRGLPEKTGVDDEIDNVIEQLTEQLREERVSKNAKIEEEVVDQELEIKLSKGKQWFSEELRSVVGVVDGYHIMAHYLYFNKDPHWQAMVAQYKDVLGRYDYREDDPKWLDETWKKAEKENDRTYKEFFYAAVGSKYLEGHIKKVFEWLKDEFIKKELPDLARDKKEEAELVKIARDLVIAIENPDAREPSNAGLYFLFRPKQIYASIKTIRRTLDTDKVMMLQDYEHLATQGVDCIIESRNFIEKTPDFGELTISVHANHPNPLHPHHPIELGDVILYELLYHLRVTGMGVKKDAYLIFERGGGEDPFVHAVDALKIMAQFLQNDPPTSPNELPLEFFGMKGPTAGDVIRQIQIVRDKAFEPMKDLLEIPEEEWTMLSQTAIRKGKKPEAWKRGEFR
jgi:hypothetical protein